MDLAANRKPHDLDYQMRTRYGITGDDYIKMRDAQDGVCAICDRPPSGRMTRLVVDHDHDTGLMRALLCNNCNVMLGQARDNADLLLAGAQYLRDWSAA